MRCSLLRGTALLVGVVIAITLIGGCELVMMEPPDHHRHAPPDPDPEPDPEPEPPEVEPPEPEPEPEPEPPDPEPEPPEPEPPLPEPDECPYPVTVGLLARVSAAGALCATSNSVDQEVLDRVSRASTVMLRHRGDLAERLRRETRRGQTGHAIVMYRGIEVWCEDFDYPAVYMDLICSYRSVGQIGVYSMPLIVCPDWSLGTCIHEIAHAVHLALPYSEREPITERFNDPDLARLWSGYAMRTPLRK